MFKNLFAKYNDLKARREEGEGGFTLIELLVVVVIIGILVAIAIPLYLNYTQGAKSNSLQSDVRNAVVSVAQCTSDNSQNLPASQTFSATALWTQALCNTAGDKVVLSNGTASLVYTLGSDSKSYTITASDGASAGSGVKYTYTSGTGVMTKGTN